MSQTLSLYQENIEKINQGLRFEYSIMDELFEFDLDLPKVNGVFYDEAFAYNKIYGGKAIQAKGAMN